MPSFIKSLGFAFNGLKIAFKEKHIKIHMMAAAFVVIAGLYFHITQTEWLICILLFGLVISLEVVNTAIEQMVNFVSPEHNSKAGQVKDLAAAAVLIVAILAIICAIIIFGKYILSSFII